MANGLGGTIHDLFVRLSGLGLVLSLALALRAVQFKGSQKKLLVCVTGKQVLFVCKSTFCKLLR